MEERDKDQAWLDAIAGRGESAAVDTVIDPAIVRKALLARKAMLDRQTPELTEQTFQRIRFRLKAARDEDDASDVRSYPQVPAFSRGPALSPLATTSEANSSDTARSTKYKIFALAASVLFVALGALQLFWPKQDDESTILRGSAQELILTTPDPESTLADITKRMQQTGTKAQVTRAANGDITVILPSTLEAIELTDSLGLPRPTRAGEIKLLVRKSLPASSPK